MTGENIPELRVLSCGGGPGQRCHPCLLEDLNAPAQDDVFTCMCDFVKSTEEAISWPDPPRRWATLWIDGRQHSIGTLNLEADSGAFWPEKFESLDDPSNKRLTLKLLDDKSEYEVTQIYPCQTGSPHFHVKVIARR